jgi:hypothetical protein
MPRPETERLDVIPVAQRRGALDWRKPSLALIAKAEIRHHLRRTAELDRS